MEQAFDTPQMVAVDACNHNEEQDCAVTQNVNDPFTQIAMPRIGEDGKHLSANGHQGDRDHVDHEEVFPRIDDESFIQRLLLEGDQPESIGSARQPQTNKQSWAPAQLIKFEDQQLEESPEIGLVDESLQPVEADMFSFHRSVEEERTDTRKKSEGISKILKIKGVGKAENQKERLARYGRIQYLENHFHEKQ